MRNYILSVLCLAFSAGQALAETKVNNGNFESGTDGKAEGWNYQVTEFLQVAKEASGNSYLRLIKGKEEYFDATQIVELSGGPEMIMLKARMRLKGFVRNNAQRWKCPMVGIEFIKADGTTRIEKGIQLTSDSGDDWFSLCRMVKVPSGSQQVKLIMVNDAAGGEVHFDDISIINDPSGEMLPIETVNTAGSFEATTEDETVIFGWRARVAGKVQIGESGDNRYLNIQGERQKTAFADTVMTLDPAWKKLRVSCRMKSESLEVGFSPTHSAKLVLEFVDADEKKLDKWITPMQLKRNTPEWTEMKSEFDVPAEARGLKISAAVQQCDGSGQFDDIKVEVLE